MPEYLYQHPASNEYKYVFQGINEVHTYVDEDKVQWKRIFTPPQLSTIGQIDPFNHNDFVNKTAVKKGTYGQLLDESQELSKKREEKLGYDPVKNSFFDNYSKSRRGLRHPNDTRAAKKNSGYDVEF